MATHAVRDSEQCPVLTPTHWTSPACISDDSVDPLTDALEAQIPTWNEHELHRRAVAFARLVGTHNVGSQTVERAFRREIDTQIYLPVENDSNTGHMKGTSTVKCRTILTGLCVPFRSVPCKSLMLQYTP